MVGTKGIPAPRIAVGFAVGGDVVVGCWNAVAVNCCDRRRRGDTYDDGLVVSPVVEVDDWMMVLVKSSCDFSALECVGDSMCVVAAFCGGGVDVVWVCGLVGVCVHHMRDVHKRT